MTLETDLDEILNEFNKVDITASVVDIQKDLNAAYKKLLDSAVGKEMKEEYILKIENAKKEYISKQEEYLIRERFNEYKNKFIRVAMKEVDVGNPFKKNPDKLQELNKQFDDYAQTSLSELIEDIKRKSGDVRNRSKTLKNCNNLFVVGGANTDPNVEITNFAKEFINLMNETEKKNKIEELKKTEKICNQNAIQGYARINAFQKVENEFSQTVAPLPTPPLPTPPLPTPPLPTPPSPSPILMNFVAKRTIKISNKNNSPKLQHASIEIWKKEDWDSLIESRIKSINSKADLNLEGFQYEIARVARYKEKKNNLSAKPKYEKVIRKENTDIKAKLFKNLKAESLPNGEGYSIKDVKENTPLMEVKKQDIISASSNPADKVLLMMVEEYQKTTLESSKPDNKKFNIYDCENNPEAALKLFIFGKALGLEPVITDKSLEALNKSEWSEFYKNIEKSQPAVIQKQLMSNDASWMKLFPKTDSLSPPLPLKPK
ncbi:MAG: hypothetical protein JWM09_1501 [Francisellaceae bacterium]|nr:hypothetical protein [Francisellaceae bacterium]